MSDISVSDIFATKTFGSFKEAAREICRSSYSVRQAITSALSAEHREHYDERAGKEIFRERAEKGLFSIEELKEGLRLNSQPRDSWAELLGTGENSVAYKTTGELIFMIGQTRDGWASGEWKVNICHPKGYFPENSSLRDSLEEEGFDVPAPNPPKRERIDGPVEW